MTDSTVLAALEAAVGAAPSDDVLRLHLAQLLLDGGEAQRAMDHCSVILAQKPDHAPALAAAARAAAALGDTARADSYRRMAEALGGKPTEGKASAPAPQQATVVPLRLAARDGEEVPIESEAPGVTLDDVAGMDQVKKRLNVAFLAPMRNPEFRKLYGKSLRGGLLLYGPPGCGKTFIARAAAGELGAKFFPVGLSDVLDMWLGQSEKNLHEIFETARRRAPAVLFFDEVDALGRKRSLMRHSAGHNVVNQLLAEMDSVGADNEGVFILGATNHPWDVDAALRRPGRFDRVLLVLPPDRVAREAILRFHMRGRPVRDLDFAALAAKTEEFSGADLAHLCESAAEIAMEESFTTGTPRPIAMSDFKQPLKEMRPSTRAWFDTARNYAQFANEGGLYDDLLDYMRSRRLL